MDRSSDGGDERDGNSHDGDGESRDGGGGGENRAAELVRGIPRRRSHFLPPPSPRPAGQRDGQGGGGRSGVGGRERRRGGPGYELSASFSASNIWTPTISIHFTCGKATQVKRHFELRTAKALSGRMSIG